MITEIIALLIGASMGFVSAALMTVSKRIDEQDEEQPPQIKESHLEPVTAHFSIPFEDIQTPPTTAVQRAIASEMIQSISDDLAKHIVYDVDVIHREYRFGLRIWVDP